MIKLSDHLYIPPMGKVIADERAEKKARQERAYAAAKRSRLNTNWTSRPSTANYDVQMSLAQLRARAREAAQNYAHFKKFLSLTRSNIIGPKGIQLQSRARAMDGKTLNVELNKKVEEAWWQWGHSETCTVSGRLDWLGVQRLIVTQLARDGEFLVEMVEADNDFGFALKVHNVDYLDETFTEVRPQGNRIIMSIEVDDDNRPQAYWLTTPPSDQNYTKGQAYTRTRVPADRMIHGFLSFDDESQVRGVTWFHATLLEGQNHQSYKEGVITSARFAANSFGFFKQTTPDGMEFTGAEDDNGTPLPPVIDISPGSFTALPPDWEMDQFDPKQPTQNHSAFSKTILMDLAAGMDIPYFALAGDMESVNFSSSRVGLDEARDIWRGLQDFVITALCRPVFNVWLRHAMLSAQLKVTSSEYKEILNPQWNARGWKYIDPTKDIAADVERLKNRLATPSEILAEQGTDYVDFLERWKADREMAATYGVAIEEIYAETPKQLGPAPSEPDGDEAGKTPERQLLNGLDHESGRRLN